MTNKIIEVAVGSDETRWRAVRAEVIGDWAIHPLLYTAGKLSEKYYSVTHVPTGRRLVDCKNKQKGREFIKAVQSLGLDFTVMHETYEKTKQLPADDVLESLKALMKQFEMFRVQK